MTTAMRRTAIVAGLVLACATVPAATTVAASAAHPTAKTYHVKGTQTPGTAEGSSYMHSRRGHTGLVGPMTSTGVLKFGNPYLYVVTGTEHFKGCLDTNGDNKCQHREPAGELFFDYVFWHTTDPFTGVEEGRCVHPITHGTGGFKGAKGLVTMHDVQVASGFRTTYRGTITLNAGHSAATTQAPAADAAGADGASAAASGPQSVLAGC
jgi:hypothetical protein